MTYSQISLKILKVNLKKYLLLFLCGSFSVMIFFTFAAMYADPTLIAAFGFDKTVLYAPTVVIVIFSIFFMMHAQSSYTKFRLPEFGLLMTLGMTKGQIWTLALTENGLISGFSFLFGVLIGTAFSRLLIFLIAFLVGIRHQQLSYSLESYWYTFLFFLAVFFLTTIGTIATIAKQEIISLLKRNRQRSLSIITRPPLGILGFLLLSASFLDMFLNSKKTIAATLARSIIACVVGLYLCIANRDWYISLASKLFGGKPYRNLISTKSIQHSFGQTKNIVFAIALLMATSIFFTNLCVLILSDAERISVGYNPFDVAYAEIDGNREALPNVIDLAIVNAGTRLKVKATLDFLNTSGFVIVSSEDLNALAGTTIRVDKGKFFLLIQVMLDDNYPHDEPKLFHITAVDLGDSHFSSQGEVIRVLFNNVDSVTRGKPVYLVVNKEDYLAIKARADSLQETGHITFLRFENWRKTKGISDTIRVALEGDKATPNWSEVARSYSTESAQELSSPTLSSRIYFFKQKENLASATLLLFSYTSLLFFLAAPVMLHFKLLLGFRNDADRYRRLFRLGITGKEVRRLVNRELCTIFLLPSVVGALVGLFYTISLPAIIGNRIIAAFYSALIISVCLGLQTISYLIYRRIYADRLLLIIRSTGSSRRV